VIADTLTTLIDRRRTVTNQRTNRKADVCSECGGPVAPFAGNLWWQAGPDDGGDVVGRTPAGWYVTHRDSAQCEAARAAAVATKQDRGATRTAALAAWRTRAENVAVVDAIDERDSYGNDCPRTTDDNGFVTVRLPYPLPPVQYRPRADGRFDSLGAFRQYRCSCESYGWSGALQGWTRLGGEVACPQHAERLRAKAATFHDSATEPLPNYEYVRREAARDAR